MIITNIEPAAKKRVRVYADEQLAFVLYKGELSRYQIKQNETMSDECYRRILDEVLTKRAKARCIYLLKSMDRTEYQLRTKLRQGEYPQEVIEKAIDSMKEFHYIDDHRYTDHYVDTFKKVKSRRQIANELMFRGISRELIEEVYEEKEAEDETAMILKWADKKHFYADKADQKEKQRFYAFLMRKGFSYGEIIQTLNGRNELGEYLAVD